MGPSTGPLGPKVGRTIGRTLGYGIGQIWAARRPLGDLPKAMGRSLGNQEPWEALWGGSLGALWEVSGESGGHGRPGAGL